MIILYKCVSRFGIIIVIITIIITLLNFALVSKN